MSKFYDLEISTVFQGKSNPWEDQGIWTILYLPEKKCNPFCRKTTSSEASTSFHTHRHSIKITKNAWDRTRYLKIKRKIDPYTIQILELPDRDLKKLWLIYSRKHIVYFTGNLEIYKKQLNKILKTQ